MGSVLTVENTINLIGQIVAFSEVLQSNMSFKKKCRWEWIVEYSCANLAFEEKATTTMRCIKSAAHAILSLTHQCVNFRVLADWGTLTNRQKGRNSWQWLHVCQRFKRSFGCSGFSTEGTLLSASAVLHCRYRQLIGLGRKKRTTAKVATGGR